MSKKLMTLLIVSILAISNLSAQNSNTGCVSGNCTDGYGTYVYSDGAKYIGNFKAGKAEGFGTCYYANGDWYVGYFANHTYDGNGTFYKADGTKQDGIWKAGAYVGAATASQQPGCQSGDCKNGYGTYLYEGGTKYTGYFKNGLIEGKGTCWFASGDRYEGEWKAHHMEGIGTYYYKDGTVKTGLWSNSAYVGAVAQTTTGCVSGNCSDGFGQYNFSNGGVYTGNFVGGQINGYGTYVYPDGDKYTGNWKSSKRDGYGTTYYKDGRVESGNWSSDAFLGATANNNAVPKIWAVVVGVAHYEYVNSLNFSDDDAYKIYAFLKSPEGGALPDNQVSILIDEDATHNNIVKEMQDKFSQAGPNDMIIFYYGGHGMKGAFIPTDCDGTTNCLYHSEVTSVLKSSPAKNKLVIADACFSGSMTDSKSGGMSAYENATASRDMTSSRMDEYYSKLKASAGGTALILSSTSEETSIEFGNFRQGAFTYFLIKGLKGEADNNTDRIVDVSELFGYVQTQVKSYTSYRQNPEISGDYDKTMPVSVVR